MSDNAKQHVTSMTTYLIVGLVMAGITILSWMGAEMSSTLGISTVSGQMWFQMIMATIKGMLLVGVFMHIFFEGAMFKWFIFVLLVIVFVLFVLTFSDYWTREELPQALG